MADDQDVVQQRALERLVDQIHLARPDLPVVGGFRSTRGLSPNAVVVIASALAVPVVIVAVVSGKWVLLFAAVAVVALAMFVLVSRVNGVRLVAETADELVVLAATRGQLREVDRFPKDVLTVAPYWDRQWAKVVLGGEHLWVSRRAYGGTIDRLAPAPD